MRKIPFDIKYRPQIESGKYKVQTREGHPVRIICWDANCPQPVVGLIYDMEALCDTVESFCENGKYWRMNDDKSHNDLFIITDEPELTELERAIKRGMLCAGLEGVSTTIIKETAKEVKDIICKECTVGLDQYWKGRDDARKEYEKPITFHYPIYYPPCFYGGICTNPMRDCTDCPRQSSGTTINTSGANKVE